MATIDWTLKYGLIRKPFTLFVKLRRAHLNQLRKAFFASAGCSELSKLGFLLGIKSDTIRGRKRP